MLITNVVLALLCSYIIRSLQKQAVSMPTFISAISTVVTASLTVLLTTITLLVAYDTFLTSTILFAGPSGRAV